MMCLCGSVSAIENWWDSHWQYRQRVDINFGKIGDDAADFPLWIQLSDAQFARTLAESNGRDLRAIDTDGKALKLEIISWTTEGVRLCVLIPKIYARKSDQFINLYFGNPKAEMTVKAGIWDAHTLTVLHFVGNMKDSANAAPSVQPVGYVAQNGWAPGIYLGHHRPGMRFERANRGFLFVDERIVKAAGPNFSFVCRFRPVGPGRLTLISANGFELAVEGSRLELTTSGKGDSKPQLISVEGVSDDQWHSVVFTCNASGETVLCLDGAQIAKGSAKTGAVDTDRMMIGRSITDTPDTQYSGFIEELRILNEARSTDWVMATALNLSDTNPLVKSGSLEQRGKSTALPAPPQLLRPYDHMQSHRSVGTKLEWNPSLGASEYIVRLYADPQASKLLKSIGTGSQTTIALTAEQAGAQTLYWTVVARSKQGETTAHEFRRLAFYDGSNPANRISPDQTVKPEMLRPADVSIELDGYLRERIDKLVQFWIQMPDKNPGMLRMLRERPEPNALPWAGIYGGQYISSGQALWRLTHSAALKQRLDSFVKEYLACQRDDGYLGPFANFGGHIDIWSHYAIIVGLVTYFEDTGYEPALIAARKVADLVIRTLGPDTIPFPKIGGGTESISHAMILLNKVTHEQRYLDFANYIVSEACNEIDGVSYFRLGRERKALSEFPACRWEGVHNIQTLSEIYWLNGDAEYREAYQYLWQTMLSTERHNTGGFSTDEGLLGTPYDPGAIETCCTVAWIALSTDMLKLTADSRVADELEWSTLNSALGSIPYDGSYSTYANQPDGRRQFGALVQGPPDGPLLSCCSTNAARALGSIANWALMRKADGLVVNYYGPSSMSANLESGNRVTLKQITKYPAQGEISMEISVPKPEKFTLFLRIPKWSTATRVSVNGKQVESAVPGTYLPVHRQWQTGDVVQIELDFSLRVWTGEEHFAGKVSLYQGPILLSCDTRYDRQQREGAYGPIKLEGARVEPLTWKGEKAPWLLAKLTDSDGHSLKLCDYASAGLSGSYYQSWFECKDSQPSPFYLKQPYPGDSASEFVWEARSGAESWTLIVSATSNLSDGQRFEGLKKPIMSLPKVKAGRYYWTVLAQNQYGQTQAANGPLEFVVR